MTKTSHGHHIAGTPADDELDIKPVDCGGSGFCEDCKFDILWFRERDKKRAQILPSDVTGLDAHILRKISAKIRENNPKPNGLTMKIPKYQLAATIYALADAMEGVAEDLESE